MNVKILMNWDIKPNRDQEYFEFIVREWVPSVTKLGIQPIGAWYTVYSREPATQILAECLAEDLDTIREVLKSTEWVELQGKLEQYVSNYHHKVVRSRGEFQI
jgi:hypothetical protein